MLKSIKLRDFAIVQETTIPFASGLNVISGETGAGKTIITKALRLCLGAKADSSFIREGSDTAHIEALFEPCDTIYTAINDLGFPVETSDPIIIKRELTLSGKNRCSINGNAATLAELQQIAPLLLDLVSQNESQMLRSEVVQRELLDRFSNVSLLDYSATYVRWKTLIDDIRELEKKKETLSRTLPQTEKEFEEIERINPEEGEEDALFAKHKEFIDIVERFQSGQEVRMKLDHCAKLLREAFKDAPTESVEEAIDTSLKNVAHAQYELESSLFVTIDEEEHNLIETRLSEINALYKKHGGTHARLMERKEALQKEIDAAVSIDQWLFDKQKEARASEETLYSLAKEISTKRQMGAKKLSSLVTADLEELNMKGAEFSILIEKTELSGTGADAISFELRANRGEKSLPLSKAPSGGEISRLLLATKLHLASADTLIFDEIDANIGGETARKVGEKLRRLAKGKQALCITHFAQVAEYADHHLRIYKEERGDRTLCHVTPLDAVQKKEELLRMLGGDATLFSAFYSEKTNQ